MQGYIHCLALAALVLAGPGRAQDAAAPGPAEAGAEYQGPDDAVLARMCSTRGAMQWSFGQTGVPGSTKLEGMIGNGFTLPAPLAPFNKAQPRATDWSGRLMEVSYSFAEKDEDRAYEFLEHISERLESAGWTFFTMPGSEAPLYLSSVSGYASFEKPVETSEGTTRVVIGLDYALGEASLTCARDDLLKAHAKEVFGDLPEGTPRPVLATVPLPAISDAASCTDPAVLDTMRAMFADRKLHDDLMAAVLTRGSYRDRLTTWMSWKMEKSGKISREELLDILMSSLSAASPNGNPLAGLEMITELFPLLEPVAAAEKARDPAMLCRSLVPMRAFMARADALTLKQTQAVQARLAQEAAKRGISLE